MSRRLLPMLVGLAAAVPLTVNSPPQAPPLTHSFVHEKGGLLLVWSIRADEIEMELTLNASGYVAVGFGSGMSSFSGGVDMIVGYATQNGTAHAGDYWSTGHAKPRPDTQIGGRDDVTVLGGSLIWSADGTPVPRMSIRFRRKLNTGDKYDAIINASAPVNLVYAWADGSPGDLHFHQDNHNHVQVDLLRADGTPPTRFGCEEVGGGARELISSTAHGTLITLQTEVAAGSRLVTAGWPYGSVADFADEVPSTGRPLLLLSTLERNVVNFQTNNRVSLAIRTPDQNCTDMMTCPRTTLFGTLERVPAAELPAAKKAYLAKHPTASAWIDFPDMSIYRMTVLDLYWVGGFGNAHYIGYVGGDSYSKSGGSCHE